ncbi:MAG: type II secretion system protein GspD [Candidatus Dadabacteria bacterium]|nr:MAG: type II secretion system protein GspD [Candidatus Dadabacteria bacterium]
MIKFIVRIFVVAFLAASYPGENAIAQSNENKQASDETEINVKNADISAIIRIFSKKTKRNYILDERVRGKVSIFLPGKVTSEEALKVLDSVLALKGFTSVPISKNLWKIVPAKEAQRSTIPTITGEDDKNPTAAMVTRLINLKFVNADDIKQLLAPLVSSNGLINAYTGTNSLILIDSEDNIVRLMKIISSLDIPFTDREMTIIPIKYADAPDIANKLTEILGEKDQKSGPQSPSDLIRARLRQTLNRGRPGNTAAGSAASATTVNTVAARAREPKIIADERTNSVIVVADEDTTARIRAIISELDSPVDLSGNRFYVYRCKNANAEELADVLSGLVGGSSSGRSSSGNNLNLSGSRQRGGQFQSTINRLLDQRRTPGRSRRENQQGSTGPSSVQLGEDVSITADPATNSLIINASKTAYMKIKDLLDQLDIKRKQVLVEALILEVGVNESLDLGTDFITSAGGKDGGVMASSNFSNNLAQLLSDPTQIGNFSLAAASSGTLTLPGNVTIPTQTVLLNAARSNSNVNVLSSPTILATDNQQAEIVVGQNVPFVASTSTSADNLNNTFNQIDRQDVGITLRITPQISSNDTVSLDIFTEVSNVVPGTANSDLGPTTTIRTSETSVISKDGQMVVIGGLMSDDVTEADNGIPFLKDVPFFGHFFRNYNDTRRRTNLLIFITPRIVKDQFDLREASLDRRDNLKNEIEYENIYPRREEVLNNPNLDRVANSYIYEGKKPSTILPPDKHKSSANSATRNSNGTSKSRPPIELHIKPEFKNSSTGAITSREDAAPPLAALKPTTIKQGSRYILLEPAGNLKDTVDFPFQNSANGKIIGIVIPAGSSKDKFDFFQAGNLYSYNIGSRKVRLRALGVFSSPSEAMKFLNISQVTWNALSPYEILNLGEEPWRLEQ